MAASAGTDSRSTAADLPPLLRRRLLIVSLLTMVPAAIFFAAFRAVQPAEWAYFVASRWGVAVLVAEAAVGLIAAITAVALSRRPGWWTLRRLRALEYLLVFDITVFVGSSQLFAFHGERLAGGAAADPYLIRLATDSMAVRWAVGIIGLLTLIPETLRRNSLLVAARVSLAMLITTAMAITDPVYAPRAGRVVALMGLWIRVASTIAIFGAYKLAELRQQAAEARRLGQYRLMRRLGAGGMGEVYLAEHVLLAPVAIKLIRPERAGDPRAAPASSARCRRRPRSPTRTRSRSTTTATPTTAPSTT